MGFLTSISQFLGGGEHQQSSSGNQAYPWAQSTFGGAAGQTGSAMDQIAGILGIGGNPAAASAGLKNYADSAGYNFAQNQGMDAVNNNMYARGLGKSGADMKGLAEFTTGLNQQYLNNYLGNLSDLSKLGLDAGGLVTGAGQTSKSVGDSQKGMAGIIGSVLGAISDRRLKRDIKRVGTYPNGLGKYEWHYSFDPSRTRYRGVMADEVRMLRPEAYIPNFRDGYAGVNYALLGLEMEAA